MGSHSKERARNNFRFSFAYWFHFIIITYSTSEVISCTFLTYFIGYLFVAYNPEGHYGIVITGGIGKLGFIVALLKLYFTDIAGPVVFVVVVGDGIFFALFTYFIFRIYKTKDQQVEPQVAKG